MTDAAIDGVIATTTANDVIAKSSVDGVMATVERCGGRGEEIGLEICFNIELKAEISIEFTAEEFVEGADGVAVGASGVVSRLANISKLSEATF